MKFIKLSWLMLLTLVSFAAVCYTSSPQQSLPVPQSEIWLMADKYAYPLTEAGTSQPNKLEVGEHTFYSLTSPDGRILALASFGAYDTRTSLGGFTEFWPKRDSSSTITLVKRPGNELLGRYPVPFRPSYLAFTPDGASLLIASLGQYSNNEKKRIAAQLFLLDLANGKLRNLVELLQISDGYWYLPEKKRVILPGWGVNTAKSAGDKTNAQPELVTCDLATGAVERVKLPEAPNKWFEGGNGKVRYLGLKNGVVMVGDEGKLLGAPLSAGEENLFVARAPNSNRFFIAGKTKKQGQVAVIEDGRVLKSFDFGPANYILFSKDGGRVFLCANLQGVVLETNSLNEVARIPLPASILEARLDPSEQRIYLNEPGGSVTVIDLLEKKQVAHFTTGRGGVKFGVMMAAMVADTLTSVSHYWNTGQSYYGPFFLDRLREIKTLALSANGNYAYVYNNISSDITVVETKAHTILKKVPTGRVDQRQFIWQLPDKHSLISCGASKLLVFDTEKGEVTVEKEFPKTTLRYDPAQNLVFALSRTGTEVWRPVPLEKIKDLAPGEKIIFKPEARRFVIFADKGMHLYDYELNLRRSMGGVLNRYQILNDLYTDDLHVILQPLSPGLEERKLK